MPVMDGIDATKTIVERRKRGLLAAAESLASSDGKIKQENDGDSNPSAAALFKDYLNLYVIALTASAMGSDKERCMEAGMDDFMTKPFAVLEMKRILNEFVAKLNNGALQTRNEACLAMAMAYKNRCTSPGCQGNLSILKEVDRSLTPTIAKSLSANSSSVNLLESGVSECAGCGSALVSNNINGSDTNGMDGAGSSLTTSSSTFQGRVCRMETPRPLRRNLDGIGCSFTGARRSQSEAMMSGLPGSTLSTLNTVTFESSNIARRASDAYAHSKREWRLGLSSSHDANGLHDIHPLDTIHGGSGSDEESEQGVTNGTTANPTHLRVKRVLPPNTQSGEDDLLWSSLQPMISLLSPRGHFSTEVEGLSSVSPPLSSSSPSSPSVVEERTGKPPVQESRMSMKTDPSGRQEVSLTNHTGFATRTDIGHGSEVPPAAI